MTEGGNEKQMRWRQREKFVFLSLKTFYTADYMSLSWQYMKYSSATYNYNMLSVCACTVCVNILYVQRVLVFICCCLHHRHARNHRTDALLEDYGYNKLSEMQFVGSSSENCTRHAQLMITSNTLTASQQSLLNSQCGQLSNAQKMK